MGLQRFKRKEMDNKEPTVKNYKQHLNIELFSINQEHVITCIRVYANESRSKKEMRTCRDEQKGHTHTLVVSICPMMRTHVVCTFLKSSNVEENEDERINLRDYDIIK